MIPFAIRFVEELESDEELSMMSDTLPRVGDYIKLEDNTLVRVVNIIHIILAGDDDLKVLGHAVYVNREVLETPKPQ